MRHAVIWRRISGGTDSADGKPVYRADADSRGDMPTAGPQCAGLLVVML